MCLPEVDEKALTGLKFAEALPRHLAVATLAARLADLENARSVLLEPRRFDPAEYLRGDMPVSHEHAFAHIH
jgi:ATP-dependent Lhr-like helicase